MVNNKRLQILNRLKDSDRWLSGEQISREIGISRVAVWKQIQTLIDQGYPIRSGHRGYRIADGPDTLTELEFARDNDILFYREVGSTMDEALRQILSRENRSGDFLVLADHQSGGIDREEGVWDSPSGGIYLTFVLNRSLKTGDLPLMKARGILALLTTLKTFGVDDLGYTERGDIFLGTKKGAGILDEYLVRGDRVQWYALGMGVHINDRPSDDGTMTSVYNHTGHTLDRAIVVKELKECWENTLGLSESETEKLLGTYARFP